MSSPCAGSRRITSGPPVSRNELIVETRASGLKGASFDMPQRVLRGEEVLLEALVKVVVLDAQGRATRLPADIRAKTDGDHGE